MDSCRDNYPLATTLPVRADRYLREVDRRDLRLYHVSVSMLARVCAVGRRHSDVSPHVFSTAIKDWGETVVRRCDKEVLDYIGIGIERVAGG